MQENVISSIKEVQKAELKKRNRIKLTRFFKTRAAVTGVSILLLITVIVILAPLIVRYTPIEVNAMNRLVGPNGDHYFGTDNLGRDLFSRILYGLRISLIIGLSVTILSTLFGLFVGLYASYYKFLDNLLMRICDGIMAFPSILLAIAVMAILGPDIKNVVICLTIVFTPYIARIIRSAAIVIREQTYIEAMMSLGASDLRIIFGHILPNALSPLIVQATYIFAEVIILEAALSFLGVGVPAPNPSLGNILYDGKLVIFSAWWMVVFPGIFVVLSVVSLNLMGDGVRDLLDPKMKK
ncbi:ABC transporter permease [Pradoshia sp. D12]|uniref:ABC transporter permease n=1 Tax=Bacillaceae TaxID=186817 RepID=UPI00112E7136|nr:MULTISPECIES: ABC transporter permease [Bacillaceae]QFK71395.1 ABC transporter permease [Pradoshia sp. D12]TPF73190.1 ABC transporter permease [Bacillus sp. D12]